MKKGLFSAFLMASFLIAHIDAYATVTTQENSDEEVSIVTYYSEKFQSGKPTNMTYYDGDKLLLNTALNGTGLECGTWHIVRNSYEDTNYFMASTSWFVEPGKANDWMVTPQIKIYGTGATLSWKAMTCDNSAKLDGFKVYISTKSAAMEDFEETPIFSVEEVSSANWVSYKLNLDKYAGELIYIAFVNDSYDKYVLAIDDILVKGPQSKADYKFTTPQMSDTGKANIKAKITNTQSTPINECKVCYTLDNNTYVQEYSDLNLSKGQSIELTNPESFDVPINQTRHYTAWIEVDGDKYLPMSDSIIGTYFVSNRRTVLEEGTGNWCSACPMGIVAMDYMEKNYPDKFIGIAIHCDNDPMLVASYQQFSGFSVFPSGLTDRKFLSAPYSISEDGNFTLTEDGFEGFFLKAQEQIAIGQIEGKATAGATNPYEINIALETRFIQDLEHKGFNIAMIILEDEVAAPDGTLYKQTNSFTAAVYKNVNTYGLLDTIPGIGGFGGGELEVPMLYNHVARGAVADSYGGLDADIPSPVQGGKVYNNELTYVIPEGMVNNLDKTSIVAMLIDAETGYIINACLLPIEGVNAVYNNSLTDEDIQIKSLGNQQVYVSMKEAGDATIEVYDLNGQKVLDKQLHINGDREVELPNAKGIYLIKVSTVEKQAIEKVVF